VHLLGTGENFCIFLNAILPNLRKAIFTLYLQAITLLCHQVHWSSSNSFLSFEFSSFFHWNEHICLIFQYCLTLLPVQLSFSRYQTTTCLSVLMKIVFQNDSFSMCSVKPHNEKYFGYNYLKYNCPGSLFFPDSQQKASTQQHDTLKTVLYEWSCFFLCL